MTSTRLETPRLLLRPFSMADVDALHQIWTEPAVRRYLWDDETIPREQTESIIETSISCYRDGGSGLWAVLEKSNEALLGFCGFWLFHDPPKLELIYGLSTTCWGQGFASEAATAMLQFGFDELAFDRIEASTDTANTASVRVMERVGMTFWKRDVTNGIETTYYAISREDFRKS